MLIVQKLLEPYRCRNVRGKPDLKGLLGKPDARVFIESFGCDVIVDQFWPYGRCGDAAHFSKKSVDLYRWGSTHQVVKLSVSKRLQAPFERFVLLVAIFDIRGATLSANSS